MNHTRVIVESPYAAASAGDLDRHLRYLRAALADCLQRGEAPFASHAIYTQPGVLRDEHPEERKMGVTAGFAWRAAAERTVVYSDLGVSAGMRLGIEHAESIGQPVEWRTLSGWAQPTGQDLEYERDFWQAKVGALLRLVEATAKGGGNDLRSQAYAIVNTDRSGRLSATGAIAKALAADQSSVPASAPTYPTTIGGSDTVIPRPGWMVPSAVVRKLLAIAHEFWPAAWFEDEDRVAPVKTILDHGETWDTPARLRRARDRAAAHGTVCEEFFIYRDSAAYRAWRDGSPDSSHEDMLHVIMGEENITLVHDEEDTRALVERIVCSF